MKVIELHRMKVIDVWPTEKFIFVSAIFVFIRIFKNISIDNRFHEEIIFKSEYITSAGMLSL